MEISSQWPETEGFFCEISWSVLAYMFFSTPTGSLDLVWRSNSTATILRKLTNKIPWRIPAWRMCFRDFLSLLVWEALGLQATSNTIHDIHLLKSCVFCCILPRSFPNYCQSEENKKGDINHQTWPSDIGNLPLSSSLSKPPKVRATFFQLETNLTNMYSCLFGKKHTSFLLPKSAIWPIASWWSLSELIFHDFSNQGFGVGSFELQHHISLGPRFLTHWLYNGIYVLGFISPINSYN